MTIGTHIIIDMYNLNSSVFDKISKKNFEIFNNFIKEILKNNNATLISQNVHHFDDNGALTVLYLLAESHLSIHTWPENNFISMDIFTCGKTNTQNIVDELKKYFEPQYVDEKVNIRGNKFS